MLNLKIAAPLVKLAVPLVATATIAACSTSSSQSPQSPTSALPAQIPLTDSIVPDGGGTFTVGMRVTGENAGQSKFYGKVYGYFKGKKSRISEVVTLSTNEPVVFANVDGEVHTASFLGDASKKSANWPATFNGSHDPSPAGTAIGTTGFSSGTIAIMKKSLVYSAGAPGFYMFGCYYHYDSAEQRTVIIVK
jgi:hypothetical protein